MAVIYLFPASLFYITSNTEFKFGFLKSSVIFFANSVKPLSETLYRKISDLNLKLEIISQGLYHLIFLVLIFYIFYIFIYKKMQKELGIKL